ncbi:effector-associated constant component EACC1 [Streptomyces shenzhenensis]|uniref:effector-associated constant component EACC1 n=1 Tax=Streptomyces shenzhenensis TaxID=943815 RepID=UPI00287BB297|nr:hypothetical protein [Streptomyces shenzhenensis]
MRSMAVGVRAGRRAQLRKPFCWQHSCCNHVRVDVRVEVTGERSADELRSLREWLVAEESLRGRVRLVARPPSEGTLGTGLDALVIALGNVGAFTGFATVAVTWLKRRAGRMEVKITRPDGSTLVVSSDLVLPQTAQELRETADRLTRDLASRPDEVDG